jgi:mannose-6-phosphate isomerase-like protein (cupin superfamily)
MHEGAENGIDMHRPGGPVEWRATAREDALMGFRRVITGHDSNGKAVIVKDEQVDSIQAGGFSYDPMWAIDVDAVVPNDGSIPNRTDFFPAFGGVRVITWVAQPAMAEAIAASMEEMEAAAPGLVAHMEMDNPGMHTTQTIDVDVVLSGEIWMELDNGVITHLKQGDVVIQNGTRHKWENRTSTPTTVLSVLVGAKKG